MPTNKIRLALDLMDDAYELICAELKPAYMYDTGTDAVIRKTRNAYEALSSAIRSLITKERTNDDD